MAAIFDDRDAVRSIFGKVIALVLLATLCAALLLSIAMDMYAFFKPQGSVLLHIEKPLALASFSQTLENDGVLRNPHIFSLYVKLKKKTALVEGFSGELLLDRAMSYREILHSLQEN